MRQESNEARALEPVAIRADEGEARWWFGALAVIKTTAAETGGQLTIVDVTSPPGEAPLHVHYRDDEGFWILEGSVTFEVGDTTIEASAGDYAFGPRNIPHRYTVGDSGCRMLFILVPAASRTSSGRPVSRPRAAPFRPHPRRSRPRRRSRG